MLTDSFKQLERLLVCLRPFDCIEVLFSALVHLYSSVQMCVQRVLDELYEAFEVIVLLENHHGIKLFRQTVLAKQC